MKCWVLILVLLAWASASFAVWPPAQRITTGPANNLNPSVSYYDGNTVDTVCLVWQRSRTNGWDIYYSTNPTGTAWTTPQVLSSQADSNLSPAVAGYHPRWVCAWVNVHGGIQDIAFSRWQAGAWTSPFAITTDGFDDADPAVWISEYPDSIWVAWSSFRSGRWSIISRVYNGSSWSPEIPVVTSPGNNRAPRFFFLSRTRLLGLAWQGDGNGNWDIYLSQFQGGIWAPPRAVTSGPQTDISPAPVPMLPISGPYYANLLWATDTLGNYEIFGTSVDSLTTRERMTTNDSSDIEPAALSHPVPAYQTALSHPIFTAWTSQRDGNSNIYAEFFMTRDVVDTNRADDEHPVVTAFRRVMDYHEWVVWQSNRDGNWNLFGSYQTHWTGVEEGEGVRVGVLSAGKRITPAPFHPPGPLTLYLTGLCNSLPLKFYDLQGRCVGTHAFEIKAPGRYELSWDGMDQQGHALPSGLYFLKPEGTSALFRIVLLR